MVDAMMGMVSAAKAASGREKDGKVVVLVTGAPHRVPTRQREATGDKVMAVAEIATTGITGGIALDPVGMKTEVGTPLVIGATGETVGVVTATAHVNTVMTGVGVMVVRTTILMVPTVIVGAANATTVAGMAGMSIERLTLLMRRAPPQTGKVVRQPRHPGNQQIRASPAPARVSGRKTRFRLCFGASESRCAVRSPQCQPCK